MFYRILSFIPAFELDTVACDWLYNKLLFSEDEFSLLLFSVIPKGEERQILYSLSIKGLPAVASLVNYGLSLSLCCSNAPLRLIRWLTDE